MDVIIGIGFDGAPHGGAGFASQVREVLRRFGKLSASIHGESWSPEWGEEQGEWFAASFDSFDDYAEARARILAVGAAHGQDAIAFTVGTVDVASCPKPEPKGKGYRDLL